MILQVKLFCVFIFVEEGCEALQNNINKNLEQISTAFINLGSVPKKVIRYGLILFLIVLVSGLVLLLLNSTLLCYSSYLDMVAKSIVKTSFSIAAEVVIGGLVFDYVFKK